MPDEKLFPKKIWFLWLQGIDNVPIVVLKCFESWLKHNPGWDMVLLDQNNFHNYISIEQGNFTVQALSDNIRINLLAKYGGIWVDATCFCNKPLDLWIYDYMSSGFFAFERPGTDRMLSSWFMACYKDNYIVAVYQKTIDAYWTANPGVRFIGDSKWRFLGRRLAKRDPQVWYSNFVVKVLKVQPYFWFHYMFEKIYLSDAKLKKMWDDSPKISADIPHSLQFAGLFNVLNDKIKEEIDNKVSPVYKLTWKFNAAELKEGTIMDYLLNGQG